MTFLRPPSLPSPVPGVPIPFRTRVLNGLPPQLLMTLVGTSAYSLFAPFVVEKLTGIDSRPTEKQMTNTASSLFVYTFVVFHFIIPACNFLQSSTRYPWLVGKALSIGLETAGMVGFLQGIGLLYDWDPWTTCKTGLSQGFVQSFPTTVISSRFGKNPVVAMNVRAAAMALIVTNLATINTIAKQPTPPPLVELGPLEILALNGALTLLFSLPIPRGMRCLVS